ncbi:glutamate transporter, putative [Ixodes scapularis]|uniref:Amino acid transporter n=1 Tax=Ixodes scapularis TaxID=6945 RepID=B7QNS1_IXOSC|nr:glutamate transporter, putative [Ixodes scapularis]|eukprot:XP_002416576.1 glutamate transporter, putative [Ixodes scapularis]
MKLEGETSAMEARALSICEKLHKFVKTHFFLFFTLGGVIAGVVLGLGLRLANPSESTVVLIGMPGEVFMRCLRMLVLPMMIASIITGSANLSGKAKGKMAMITFGIFIGTSFMSALIGLSFVTMIHPGSPELKAGLDAEDEIKGSPRLLDTFLDLIRQVNAFPENLVEACVEQVNLTKNITSGGEPREFCTWITLSIAMSSIIEYTSEITVRLKHFLYTLPLSYIGRLIVFCVVFGGALGALGDEVEILRKFFAALDVVVMKIVFLVMWMTPVGVMSLLCSRILAVSSIVTLFEQMALLVATVLSGLAVELFVVECLLYFLVTRKNPFKFLVELAYVGLCAFGRTRRSAPVMPLTLKCLEENCGLDSRVTRFVVPVGVTVNMNGTALFITVSSIFIAQLNDIALGSGDYFAILITATAVSVAATSVPSAALFLMVMTLSVIGAPVSDVSLLFTVEWLLDRARTVNNCLGDCFTGAMVDHICFKKKAADLSEVVVDDEVEKLRDSVL